MLTLDERPWRKAAMGLLLANQKPRYETSDVLEFSSRGSPATSTTCHFLSLSQYIHSTHQKYIAVPSCEGWDVKLVRGTLTLYWFGGFM